MHSHEAADSRQLDQHAQGGPRSALPLAESLTGLYAALAFLLMGKKWPHSCTAHPLTRHLASTQDASCRQLLQLPQRQQRALLVARLLRLLLLLPVSRSRHRHRRRS